MSETPLEIVLILSGKTEFDAERRIRGTLNVPLSESGLRENERVLSEIQSLQIDAIYTCPCESVKKTGEYLAKAMGIKCRILDKLTNVNLGLWQGMLLDEIKSKQPKVFKHWQEHPETVCPPQGETLLEAQDRVIESLNRLKKKHAKGGRIGLVVPDPLARVVKTILQNREMTTLPIKEQKSTWECFPVTSASLS